MPGEIVLPRSPGTYLLILHLPAPCRIAIGRLGEQPLAAGFYSYVGSALGPGGLAGRLKHHLRPVRRPRWHVDYLRAAAPVVALCHVVGERRREHDWAMRLAGEFSTVLPGFGTSDCRCRSHLLYSEAFPATLAGYLAHAFPDDPPPHCLPLE